MAKQATLTARIDRDLKNSAESLLSKFGMTHSEFINMSYHLLWLRKGLPFDVKLPNAETLEAIKEANEGKNLVEYESVDALFDELERL